MIERSFRVQNRRKIHERRENVAQIWRRRGRRGTQVFRLDPGSCVEEIYGALPPITVISRYDVLFQRFGGAALISLGIKIIIISRPSPENCRRCLSFSRYARGSPFFELPSTALPGGQIVLVKRSRAPRLYCHGYWQSRGETGFTDNVGNSRESIRRDSPAGSDRLEREKNMIRYLNSADLSSLLRRSQLS